MKQHFNRQLHPTGLMYLLETDVGITSDGNKNKNLEAISIDRSDLETLGINYEFVRMATDAIPIFKLKENK